MFTYASYPIYGFGTDVLLTDAEIEIRIFASGDDRDMWDIQFEGANERWHTVPDAHRKAILDFIETTDPLTWGEILCTARTNPTLGDAMEAA